MTLTFDQLREANRARIPLFKNKQGKTVHNADGSGWPVEKWIMALTGELGELCNFLKKVDRGDFPNSPEANEWIEESIAYELADIQIYLDIVALSLNINLGAATRQKFNQVSQRQAIPVELNVEPPYGWVRRTPDEFGEGSDYNQGAHRPDGLGWIPLYTR